ncbi:hypothetical protein M1K46_02450 [Fictibacillus sp. WQ 8-8]|uniref:hypothetical protein n=1 Tax=Fictibacillus sp. WQ 8-8 TaxID=2938788 RepID=UPI00210CD23A|nr:hypothetical protein [Fictibacillus sp. WQ 8-8]MCQ6264527.1 hypothetical protein [Fictibacillus sp. WQ 8-8]
MKKPLIIYTSIACFITVISFGIYHQSHIQIWDQSFTKNDIKDIIFYSNDRTYKISKPKEVLTIAKELSKMVRESKVSGDPLLIHAKPKYDKILIQIDNLKTYGGSLSIEGDRVIQNASGSYWSMNDKELSRALNAAIKHAEVLN